jgi:aldoxime dehydratase
MGIQVYARTNPLRRPKGFEPTVQRWSASVPGKFDSYVVAIFGVQGDDAQALRASPFFAWFAKAQAIAAAPDVHDHARYTDETGQLNHLVTAYWVDKARFAAWCGSSEVASWWNDAARLDEACGYFREEMTVPLERQETLYWQDYPAGLCRSGDVGVYPTPYCGYYGAMRDRIPLAAVDPLQSAAGTELRPPQQRQSKGAHWQIVTPHNLAVIRSATFWGRCDAEQQADFEEKLRRPLERGMDFLRNNAVEAGCCSLRYQGTCEVDGKAVPEAHALGYFLGLANLENWAERHSSHHAIFSSAMARYRKYGAANQLRTWHEVFILPQDGQRFEYVNCSPGTGLLPWFDGKQLA